MKPKLISMGHKHGEAPSWAAWLDVTHFRNPYPIKTLRNLSGTHWKIAEYIINDSRFKYAYEGLLNSVRSMIECGEMVIYIACTGGQHRSVYLAERLARDLNFDVAHRDLRFPSGNLVREN